MVTTLLLVVAVTAAAGALALVVNRRRPDPPTAPQFATPQQLDRTEFDHATRPWLFALFSSSTCLSCRDAREVLAAIDGPEIGVQEVELAGNRRLHDRYRIDAVPTVVLADREGVVRWSYLGAPPPDAVHDILVELGLGGDGTAVDLPSAP